MNSEVSSLIFLAIIGFAFAVPSILVEDEDGQHYQLTPILSRQRREEPQLFGGGGANGKSQGGLIGINNPNGSGGSVGYSHTNGFGHTVSAEGRVPVWSSQNRYGQSTLNLGAGATQHFGGPAGNRNLDKTVGLSFNHRW